MPPLHRFIVLIMLCALLVPAHPATAHPSSAATPWRASANAAVQSAPIPPAPSQPSTGVAAARAVDIQQEYEARHGLDITDLDVAQFSALAVQTHQIAAITLGGPGDTDPHDQIIRLPPGWHTSVLLDVQTTANTSSAADALLSVILRTGKCFTFTCFDFSRLQSLS